MANPREIVRVQNNGEFEITEFKLGGSNCMYFVGASYVGPILFFTCVLGSFIFVRSKLLCPLVREKSFWLVWLKEI